MAEGIDIKPILVQALKEQGPSNRKLARNELTEVAQDLEAQARIAEGAGKSSQVNQYREEAKVIRRLASENVYETVEKTKNFERKKLVTSDIFVKADRNYDGFLDAREIDEMDFHPIYSEEGRELKDQRRDGKITKDDFQELEQDSQADIFGMLMNTFKFPIKQRDLLNKADELERKYPLNTSEGRFFDCEIALFRRLAKSETFDKIAIPESVQGLPKGGGLYKPQIQALSDTYFEIGSEPRVTIDDIKVVEESSKRPF